MKYMERAIEGAVFEPLEGGEGFYATIPGFQGLWAQGLTMEACKDELLSVLEGWLALSVERSMAIPTLSSIGG